MRMNRGLTERSPARGGESLGVAGDPVDPDREVGLAEFDSDQNTNFLVDKSERRNVSLRQNASALVLLMIQIHAP